MLKAFKKTESGRGPFHRLSDSQILLFVSRTLEARQAGQDAPDIFSKLQSLRDIVDRQEVDLLDWPDSPGKDRFYASLLKAKGLVGQIAEALGDAAKADDGSSEQEPR